MATVFKTFLNDDVVTSRTLLHEAIPITGSLIVCDNGDGVTTTQGAYSGPHSAASNVKTYPHGMFQSVYDYPYASSSANHIFDVTCGIHPEGINYDNVNDAWSSKKKNIYNQMAQVLVGHDTEGNILKFDQDGDFAAGGVKYTDVFFLNIARLISKDEIRKGSFSMTLGIGQPILLHNQGGTEAGNVDPATKNCAAISTSPSYEPDLLTYITVSDDGAATDYRVNSPAGEYGILKVTAMRYNSDEVGGDTNHLDEAGVLALYEDQNGTPPDAIRVGLIYYQAGIVVLDRSLFAIGTESAGGGTTDFPIDLDNFNAADSGTDRPGIIPFDAYCETSAHANIWYNHSGLYTDGPIGGNADDGDGLHWSPDDRAMQDYTGVVDYAAGDVVNADFDQPLVNGDTFAFGDIDAALIGGSIDQLATGLRGRITDIGFNNTTELNSTIYFCRVNHNDFNYSSNPTYLGEAGGDNNSKIRVKRSTTDAPVSYVTTIGLYSADNELLAVAKLSEPLRKDPTNEMTLRVRLDY